jgi:hypothetical protein
MPPDWHEARACRDESGPHFGSSIPASLTLPREAAVEARHDTGDHLESSQAIVDSDRALRDPRAMDRSRKAEVAYGFARSFIDQVHHGTSAPREPAAERLKDWLSVPAQMHTIYSDHHSIDHIFNWRGRELRA